MDKAKKRRSGLRGEAVQEVSRWKNSMKEKTSFVEAACQNYEVSIEDKQAGKGGGIEPSNWCETQSTLKKKDRGLASPQERTKLMSFWLSSEI